MEEDKKKSGKTEHEMRWYISLAVLVFVLFCCCTMFFFIPVQWCLKGLGHYNEGITADYLRTCDCIPH